MRRRNLLGLLPAASLVSTAAPRHHLDPAFERQITGWMKVRALPGLVVGQVAGGRLAWAHGFGQTAVGTGQPVTADTLFQAASLTKQVTAHIAHRLHQAQQLDFDAPLVSYVDDLSDPKARQVTVRQVLSHSSGFPNWRFQDGTPLRPEFEPGSRWQYSGEGYFYLQRIIEKVTRRAFGDAVREMVFQPLGMESSVMMWAPSIDSRCAQPHTGRGELRRSPNEVARSYDSYAKRLGRSTASLTYEDSLSAAKDAGTPALPNNLLPNAAASMLTSANDYGRFVAAALKVEAIRHPEIKFRTGEGWELGWGLGWGVEQLGGHTYLWQWGDNPGFKNVVLADPARQRAVFVFTNSDAGAKVHERIVAHLMGPDHPSMLWI